MSFMVTLLIFVELLIAITVAFAWGYHKYRKLKDGLTYAEEKLARGPSKKFINAKIAEYLEEQLKQTELKRGPKEEENYELTAAQILLVEVRMDILDSELRTFNSHRDPDGEVYWKDIFDRYESLIPEPEVITKIETVIETIEVEVPIADVVEEQLEDDSDDSMLQELGDLDAMMDADEISEQVSGVELGETMFDTATDELNRLRNVVGRQYDSIDELKLKIRDLEDDDEDIYKDDPVIAEMSARLREMEAETNQMDMCVKVMEDENNRLRAVIGNMAADSSGESGESKLKQLDGEAESVTKIAKDLQAAENLIRGLIQTNKEQLQCIAMFESDIEATTDGDELHTDEKFESSPGNSELSTDEGLEESKQLITNLVQANKEHLQCLAVLESEVEELRGQIEEKDVMLEMYQSQINGNDAEMASVALSNMPNEEAKQITAELNIKLAEFELLQLDYDNMRAKYLDLVKQSQG